MRCPSKEEEEGLEISEDTPEAASVELGIIQLVCCLVNDTRWSLNFKISPTNRAGIQGVYSNGTCSHCRNLNTWGGFGLVFHRVPPSSTHNWVRLLFTFFSAAFAFMWRQFIQIETLDKLNLHVFHLIVIACIYPFNYDISRQSTFAFCCTNKHLLLCLLDMKMQFNLPAIRKTFSLHSSMGNTNVVLKVCRNFFRFQIVYYLL